MVPVGTLLWYRDCSNFGKSTSWASLGLGIMHLGNSAKTFHYTCPRYHPQFKFVQSRRVSILGHPRPSTTLQDVLRDKDNHWIKIRSYPRSVVTSAILDKTGHEPYSLTEQDGRHTPWQNGTGQSPEGTLAPPTPKVRSDGTPPLGVNSQPLIYQKG